MKRYIRKARRKRQVVKWLHKGKKKLESIKLENNKDYKEKISKINQEKITE